MNKKYKLNKEWLDLMLENKNNSNLTFNLSDNDTRILLNYIDNLEQEIARLKDKINGVYEERDYLYNKTTTESKYIIQQLKDKIEKAIKYLYEHSEYNDEYGIHYINEDEYCVDYLLDILKG